MTSADGLQRFESELHPEVVRDVRSWASDRELSRLLAKLQSHSERKPFFDAWAEAVLARRLRSLGCHLRFEVPTPNDRRADFEVNHENGKFCLHVKRIDTDRPPRRHLVVSSRLRVLERIRRPYVVQVRWHEGIDDADMQTLVQRGEEFITSGTARVGDEQRILGEDGREIGGVRIIAPNDRGGGDHVTVTIGLPTGFIDLSPRMRRLLNRAHEQFMPKIPNVIVLASGHEDDLIDFEAALLGSHIERWDQFPPRGRRIAHGRAPDGFWHGRRFDDSMYAGWMRLSPREEVFCGRLYVRKAVGGIEVDEHLSRLLKELFESA